MPSKGGNTTSIKPERTLHFRLKGELSCPCCGREFTWPNLLLAIGFLEWIRGRVNSPLRVNSAYRCPKYNTAIGGATASKHLTCAVDISSARLTPEELYQMIEADPQAAKGGIGLYSWGVHWDPGPRRRWKG